MSMRSQRQKVWLGNNGLVTTQQRGTPTTPLLRHSLRQSLRRSVRLGGPISRQPGATPHQLYPAMWNQNNRRPVHPTPDRTPLRGGTTPGSRHMPLARVRSNRQTGPREDPSGYHRPDMNQDPHARKKKRQRSMPLTYNLKRRSKKSSKGKSSWPEAESARNRVDQAPSTRALRNSEGQRQATRSGQQQPGGAGHGWKLVARLLYYLIYIDFLI